MAPATVRRIDAVDVLRGTVMVLMALDHTRDYFGNAAIDPTDLSQASPALFMTRWVTHVCAPVFAFLAGTGAYLAGSRGRSRGDLAAFLASRGVWLIFLELTVVRLGLFFDPVGAPVILTVLWSIGASFVVLAGLVFLPSRAVGRTRGAADRDARPRRRPVAGRRDPRRDAGGRRDSAPTRNRAAARWRQPDRRLSAPPLAGDRCRGLRLWRGHPARAGAEAACDVGHGRRHDRRLRDPAGMGRLWRSAPVGLRRRLRS